MEKEGAELIGMHVGDGTLYKTNSGGIVWELRGSIHEKEYYEYVKMLLKKTLDADTMPKYRGPDSYGIQTTNKIITQFFIGSGFKPGKKTHTVRIPNYIKSANDSVKKAFVRGLFDTDGCIRFDKNRTPYYYYPKIEFGFASKLLVEELVLLLEEMGFRLYRWKSKRNGETAYKICLAGFQNLEKWIKEINPANSKHNMRIESGLLNKSKVSLKARGTNL